MDTRAALLDCRGLEEEALFARALTLTPSPRREKALRYAHSARRAQCVGAWLLARWLGAEGVDAAGRPVLQGGFVSLSHNGVYALAAAAPRPIGADVQRRRPLRRDLSRKLSPAERAFLASLPPAEREAAFYTLWCRKESYLKLHGGGTLGGFSALEPEPGRRYVPYPLPGYECCLYLEGDPPPLERPDLSSLLNA